MLGWAVTFLIIALVSGVLAFSAVGAAATIAWTVFVVSLVLSIVGFIHARKSERDSGGWV